MTRTEFDRALKRLRESEWAEAMARAQRTFGQEPDHADSLSYAGLFAALAHNWIADGELLCQEAIKLKPNDPQLYINLARVYQRAGRRTDVIKTLQQALVFTDLDFRIRRALERSWPRRQPVLPFLRRGHFLNRVLGRLRQRVVGPLSTT